MQEFSTEKQNIIKYKVPAKYAVELAREALNLSLSKSQRVSFQFNNATIFVNGGRYFDNYDYRYKYQANKGAELESFATEAFEFCEAMQTKEKICVEFGSTTVPVFFDDNVKNISVRIYNARHQADEDYYRRGSADIHSPL